MAIPGELLSQGTQTIIVWAQFIGALILILGIGIFMIIHKSYNIKVILYEQTGLGVRTTIKKGKKLERVKGNELKIFPRETIALPTGNYLFPTGKNGYIISLYKDKNRNYHPIPLRWDAKKNPLQLPDDSDMRFWLTNHLKEAESAYKSNAFWDKYGNVIVLGGVIAFAAIILIIYGKFYFDGINQVSQSIGSQMSKLEQTMRTIGGSA